MHIKMPMFDQQALTKQAAYMNKTYLYRLDNVCICVVRLCSTRCQPCASRCLLCCLVG